MPYRVEKGLFPLAIEQYFNEGLDGVGCWCWFSRPCRILRKCAGPRRRLRAIWRYCSIANQLRAAKSDESKIAQVTPENSLVMSAIFQGAAAKQMPHLQTVIARDWFGMKEDGPGQWRRPASAAWKPGQTYGHWEGYNGNAELIVVEALQRMLEVSLGLDHQTVCPRTVAEQKAFEKRLCKQATRVWPVYVFITCPQPWFEAWLTWHCHSTKSPVRGQVTVNLSTPGHERPVSPSAIDLVGDQPEVPAHRFGQPITGTIRNPYFLHGRDPQVVGNSGYDGKYIEVTPPTQKMPATFAVKGADPTSAPISGRAHQGMWVVTHENHDSTICWTSYKEPEVPNWHPGRSVPVEAWDLPPIAQYRCATVGQRADLGGRPDPQRLDGYYDVVVVSPASRDGGVPTHPLSP